MEDATGWTFTRVTGEEHAGYADGGYVTDKAVDGKRSYRIIKLPVEKLSDKWPMPQRTTWGEIEQEIAVEPGQTYAVVFAVFNNYGGGYRPAVSSTRCSSTIRRGGRSMLRPPRAGRRAVSSWFRKRPRFD